MNAEWAIFESEIDGKLIPQSPAPSNDRDNGNLVSHIYGKYTTLFFGVGENRVDKLVYRNIAEGSIHGDKRS